jgi:hypothetical protein
LPFRLFIINKTFINYHLIIRNRRSLFCFLFSLFISDDDGYAHSYLSFCFTHFRYPTLQLPLVSLVSLPPLITMQLYMITFTRLAHLCLSSLYPSTPRSFLCQNHLLFYLFWSRSAYLRLVCEVSWNSTIIPCS